MGFFIPVATLSHLLYARACNFAVIVCSGWGPCGIDIKDANHELYLATSPDVANTTGQYFVSDRPRRMPGIAQDVSARQRLWKILEEQTGGKYDD